MFINSLSLYLLINGLFKDAEYYVHTYDRISLNFKEKNRRTFSFVNIVNSFLKLVKNLKVLEKFKIYLSSTNCSTKPCLKNSYKL